MYKINKDSTVSAIKADVKAKVVEDFLLFLAEKYGEDSVGMVRTGSTSKTNEIGFIFDEVDDAGATNPIVVTINPTVKEFSDRKTDKRKYEPFDFYSARNEYDSYAEKKATQAVEAAERKTKKIEQDKARRAKAKEKNVDVV